MAREFISADYEEILEARIRLGDVLPANHLARFVVGIIGGLDMHTIYAGYSERGGAAYAPEMLLGLLVYGYASGLFSSRKIERATYESVPFIYIAGGKHPDHDTINTFRRRFLEELKELFVQVLLLAQGMNVLHLGTISLDGVHPGDMGHALVANAFISTINSFYKSSIPLIDLSEYTSTVFVPPAGASAPLGWAQGLGRTFREMTRLPVFH